METGDFFGLYTISIYFPQCFNLVKHGLFSSPICTVTPGATKDSDFGGWVWLPGGVGLDRFTKNLRYLKWRYERTLFTGIQLFWFGVGLASSVASVRSCFFFLFFRCVYFLPENF